MPYTEQQKRQHIREIQSYLFVISVCGGRITTIAPNGVYGKDTEENVAEFQREYGLQASGEVDSDTWDKIVEVYRNFVYNKAVPYNVFKHTVKKGDEGEPVYTIQVMLGTVRNFFDGFPGVDVNGRYDDKTRSAVRSFQYQTGLPENGEVDVETWNLLVSCAEQIK